MMKQLRQAVGVGAMAASLLITTGARAMGDPQVKDDLFDGADKFSHGAKSSTEVNLDKRMLGMAAKFSGSGDGAQRDGDLVKKLDFVIVRSYEYEKAGQYNMSDVEEFQKRLDAGGWSHIVKERSATENTDVCVKVDGDGQFSELVVIAAEPLELTFVHLKGHMSMDELTKAGAKYGVPQGTSDDADKLKRRQK
jgi:hypothetical protein